MADRAQPSVDEVVRGMRTEDFDYPLDEALIAQRPLPERDASRLLQVRRSDSAIEDGSFRDLARLILPGDVVVLNESQVFPARLLGYKPSGAAAEVLLIEPGAAGWQVEARTGRGGWGRPRRRDP